MARRHLIDVHVLLVRGHEILLCQRRDPNPLFDEQWHLPSGKLENESVLEAAAREAGEEVGVLIETTDLRCVHTIHVNGSGPEPRLGLFFATNRWVGEPSNREPEKCAAVCWFTLDCLPTHLIPYTAAGIRGYREGTPFSMLGWTDQRVLAPAQTAPCEPTQTRRYGTRLLCKLMLDCGLRRSKSIATPFTDC
jgi:8-oxo-dGTP diphosphatase